MQNKSNLALAVLVLFAGCAANTILKPLSLQRGSGEHSYLSSAAIFWTRRSVHQPGTRPLIRLYLLD
jgi:hypothetical protein